MHQSDWSGAQDENGIASTDIGQLNPMDHASQGLNKGGNFEWQVFRNLVSVLFDDSRWQSNKFRIGAWRRESDENLVESITEVRLTYTAKVT
jgi:hypothetical protein